MAEHLVGKLAQFSDPGRRIVTVGGTEIGVFRVRGSFHAYRNVCRHQGGPVCSGMIVGKVEAVLAADGRHLGERFSAEETHLVCPWHGVEYDIATGACASDRRWSLERFEVVVRGDEIYVVV